MVITILFRSLSISIWGITELTPFLALFIWTVIKDPGRKYTNLIKDAQQHVMQSPTWNHSILFLMVSMVVFVISALLFIRTFITTNYFALFAPGFLFAVFSVAFVADHISVMKGESVDLFYGFIPDMALLVIFGIVFPFLINPLIKPDNFIYSTRLTLKTTITNKSMIHDILKNYESRSCLYQNPCTSTKTKELPNKRYEIQIKTGYRGAHSRDGYEHHLEASENVLSLIKNSKSFLIMSKHEPGEKDVSIKKRTFQPGYYFPFPLISMVFIFIFEIISKNLSGRILKSIEMSLTENQN